MARGKRKRTRKGISKKANIQRRATKNGITKSSRKQTEKEGGIGAYQKPQNRRKKNHQEPKNRKKIRSIPKTA